LFSAGDGTLGAEIVRLLIVEDDPKMADLIRRGLEENGHSGRVAHDGPTAVSLGRSVVHDAIVLDVMLPGFDGFEVTRRLRREGCAVPILMLTGRDAVADIVKGLSLGADDYLTKPFSLRILIARLEALVRRASAVPSNRLQVADLILDLEEHEVWRGRTRVTLTKTEFDILAFLMRRAGHVVTRETLIDAVWGETDREIENNTLDVFIKLLRAKVDSALSKRLIQTVRGVGYTIRETER
jgi:DNA-binding response OmpR family regulator